MYACFWFFESSWIFFSVCKKAIGRYTCTGVFLRPPVQNEKPRRFLSTNISTMGKHSYKYKLNGHRRRQAQKARREHDKTPVGKAELEAKRDAKRRRASVSENLAIAIRELQHAIDDVGHAIDDTGSEVGCTVDEDFFTYTKPAAEDRRKPTTKPAAEDRPKPAAEEQPEEAQEAACDWPTHDSELPRLSPLPSAPPSVCHIFNTLSSRVQPGSGGGDGGVGGMTSVQREASFVQSCGYFGVGGRMPSSLSYTTGSPEVKKTSSLVHDVDAGTSSMHKVYSPDPFNVDDIGGEGGPSKIGRLARRGPKFDCLAFVDASVAQEKAPTVDGKRDRKKTDVLTYQPSHIPKRTLRESPSK